ncbi:MAG: MBL fold metallo-hydrolase [Acidobacteriota bacterium]|nr:MBL fold metallo-hydrolase [Acidobacteriota bacterium]
MTMLQRAEKVGRKFQNPVPTTVGGGGLFFKALLQMIRNREERFPKTPLGPFRTEASVYATQPESGLRVTWMGHSSMLLEIDGVRVLLDPVWDERASPVQWFGPRRFFAPPLALDDLPPIDAVLVSHDHYDHLSAGTVWRFAKLQPTARWVTSLGAGAILSKFGVRPQQITELNWTESVRVETPSGASCEFTSVPSRHFSGRSAFNRNQTLWAAFILRGAKHNVYFGADSGWWEGFAEIGAAHGPFDLTMLEVGAFNELWKDIHMGPDGAAQSFQDMGATGLLMPIHWGLFDLALHAWRQPIERLLQISEPKGLKLWSPTPGLPTEVACGVELRSDWWLRPPSA